MSKHHFSFKEAFVFGWNKTKQHYWFSFLTFLIVAIITSSVESVPILSTIVGFLIALSITYVSLLVARDHHFDFSSLIEPILSPKKVTKLLILGAIYMLFAIIVGTLLYLVPARWFSLLIIAPAIFVMVRFHFFTYTLVDNENDSIQELIKKSYKLTDKHFFMLFAFLILIVLLNVAGALLFLVGLVVTVPVSVFSSAYVYNRLKEHSI
ncbi:MAG: hypothetical protein RI935_26 [Candidatus Parcubacteria bacterium]|jgi:hypothetical protein